MRLIPQHHAACFKPVLFLQRPHDPRPAVKELVAELDVSASGRGRMCERYAEPVRRHVDQFSLEFRATAAEIQQHLTSTNEARLRSLIQVRVSPVRVQNRITKCEELSSNHCSLRCM